MTYVRIMYAVIQGTGTLTFGVCVVACILVMVYDNNKFVSFRTPKTLSLLSLCAPNVL